MTVTVISANLGGIDTPPVHVPQVGDGTLRFVMVTDETMPLRTKALLPRMQAKIPKMFGWDLYPGADLYLWLDASFDLAQPGSVQWFVDELGTADLAAFKHPARATLRAEIHHVAAKLAGSPRAGGAQYLIDRYEHEDLDGLLKELERDQLADLPLVNAGAFIYRPTPQIQAAMKQWWYYVTRYHVNDQPGLAASLHVHGCRLHLIHDHIFRTPWLTRRIHA